MTSSHSDGSANLMQELYFQKMDKLNLRGALDAVPFGIQHRRKGFSPAQRCMTLLAAQAQQCHRLTDWTPVQRRDSRLEHWLGNRPAPHPSTLSRTLAACDKQTVDALRREVLVPLTDQALLLAEATAGRVFIDIDNKSLTAEGDTYEGTANGRMSDGRYGCGYRLHLTSLANMWPLEMEFTGANAHAVPSAMLMVKRLMPRVHGSLRGRMVVRADSNHGSVHFIRFLNRYRVGYLLKSYNTDTAKNLWKEHPQQHKIHRVVRDGKPDLLAIDLESTRINGMTRKTLRNGRQLRKACHVIVPRVVVYHEDPSQVQPGKQAVCFALLTMLPPEEFTVATLLEEAYLPRGGDIENIFCQLDQAFAITHMRSRSFYGNYTFVMLSMIAATLTQLIREEARLNEQPIPPGLKETLVAAANCGLRLRQDPQAGCELVVTITSPYTTTFQTSMRCSYQHRFRYAA
jgi:hypothetical protein